MKKRNSVLMKLENRYKLSSAAVDGILEDVSLLLEDRTVSLRSSKRD